MLNILNIGDIHFGNNDSTLLYNELKKYFINKIDSFDNKIDLIVINGDLTHKKLSFNDKTSTLVLKFIQKIAQHKDIKIRVVQGTFSHDANQLDNLCVIEHPDLKVHKTVTAEYINGYKILFIPEEYPKNKDEYYQEFFNINEDDKYDLVFMHGTFKKVSFLNQVILSEKNINSAPIFDEEPMMNIVKGPIICGHIHVYKNFKNKIYYAGSYTRTNFGEEDPKGYLHIEYDIDGTGNYIVDRVINKDAPKYTSIDVSKIKHLTAEKISKVIDEFSDNGKNKIRITNVDRNSVVYQVVSKTGNAKIKTIKDTSEITKDDTYDFVFEDNQELPNELSKYIEIKYGLNITPGEIANIISSVE